MSINYSEVDRLFILETKNTSYIIAITDIEGFVNHVYYGKKIPMNSAVGNFISGAVQLTRFMEPPFVPSKNERDRTTCLEGFHYEYSGNNIGDFRDSAISVLSKDGHSAVLPLYVSHSIISGKKKLEGLPACFGTHKDCTTLEILCRDPVLNLDIILCYTVFDEYDVITRNVKIVNKADDFIQLKKVMSLCMDMENDNFDLITLNGSWARERHIQRQKIGIGYQGISSTRGESGHQNNPFIALANGSTTQNNGEIYGFSFVYSGNFVASASLNQVDTTRILMGINPEGFGWKLDKGASFTAPEVVMTFSTEGIGGMSRNFHDLYRNHLIRGEYTKKERPILINNWEATYFNFDTDKLLSIATEAAKAGIEMLVMDDGWFGARSSDNLALGDWFVNEEKLPGGLSRLVEGVNKLGMKFGIWFEPEMVSPDSDLYRAHPDWAISIPGRKPALARNQLVLDLTRPETFDYIWERLKAILSSANIEYVKWDMNRPITDWGSSYLPADRQCELMHRQMLAVYALQEKLITEFPHILLENCSGGGGRFDAGMLYYSPQIWCSDDTDAIERLSIQEGTAVAYPLSCMGAHVSDCPNHITGRTTPFATRGHVALAGTFGYELDITRISETDRSLIPSQVACYKKYNALVRQGDYYRIASYSENGRYDIWETVAKDKSEVLVTVVQVVTAPLTRSRKIKLFGLDPKAAYTISYDDGSFPQSPSQLMSALNTLYPQPVSGTLLMNAGILVPPIGGDYRSLLVHLSRAL